jgi:hypothetical protein
MLAGTAKLVVLTGLLLLHPTRPPNAKMRKAIKNANPKRPHLPMHPPRPHGLPRGEQRLLGMYSLRKISSVEAANLFGKPSRLIESTESAEKRRISFLFLLNARSEPHLQ